MSILLQAAVMLLSSSFFKLLQISFNYLIFRIYSNSLIKIFFREIIFIFQQIEIGAKDWLSLHFSSDEVKEGMQGFVEKRKPDYIKIRSGDPEL